MDAGACSRCVAPLDLGAFAQCDVCSGTRLCMECARSHLCTSECAARGCHPGLCVRMVRYGVVAASYGVE